MRIKLALVAFLASAASLIPFSASAFDIPLLTWERGREQELVLGGEQDRIEWTIRLEGQGIEPLVFRKSSPNEAGYFVYVVDLPSTLPLGAYTLTTEGMGLPKTIVASVNVIDNFFFSITNVPRDLIFVIALFNFAVATLSTFRSLRYARLRPVKTYLSEIQEIEQLSPSLAVRFLRLRTRLSGSLRESMFKYFVIRDQQALFSTSPTLPIVLPILGMVSMGFLIAQVETYGDLSRTPSVALSLIAIIGLFDLFSATFLAGIFWFSQIILGNVTSFRDGMVLVSVGLFWTLPGLFRNIYMESMNSIGNSRAQNRKLLALLFCPTISTIGFFFLNKLIDSVLISVTSNRNVEFSILAFVFVASTLRSFLDLRFMLRSDSTGDFFNVARVASPVTAFTIMLLLYGYGYMWSEDAEKSLLFAGLFSLPFLLLSIRLNEILILRLARVPRSIFIEPALVCLLSAALYFPIRNLPLLG
ncbi:MAG: hypothetical protein ACO3P3_04760, partial [Candidatus Nanopelagicales bacterium]